VLCGIGKDEKVIMVGHGHGLVDVVAGVHVGYHGMVVVEGGYGCDVYSPVLARSTGDICPLWAMYGVSYCEDG